MPATTLTLDEIVDLLQAADGDEVAAHVEGLIDSYVATALVEAELADEFMAGIAVSEPCS